MVPEGWTETSLESLTSQKVTYGVVKPGDERTGGVPFVRGGDFPNGTILISELRTISNEISNAYKRTLLRGGEILVSLVGYPGATAIVPNELVGANIARQVALVRPNERVDRDYLFQFLRSDIGQRRMLSQTIGSAQQVINLKNLNALHVACPPPPEQRKIADILSTWDRAIETTEALLATARDQKRALMQSLLTGRRRFPEFEGQGWREVRLGDVAKVDARSLTSKTPADFEFEYISLSNVEPGRMVGSLGRTTYEDAPSRARRKVAAGDLLVSTVRPNLLGFAKVTAEYADCIASTGFAVVSPSSRADGSYLFHYLFSHHMKSQFHALVVGSNYPAINSIDVKKLRVRLPTVEEQRRIGQIFDDCETEIACLADQIEKLRTEKKALMQQLLTGKRRVAV